VPSSLSVALFGFREAFERLLPSLFAEYIFLVPSLAPAGLDKG
jgi:hypothetical protein